VIREVKVEAAHSFPGVDDLSSIGLPLTKGDSWKNLTMTSRML
jgi:hypothetical protein